MPRKVCLIAGSALALILGLPAFGQDSPSLGDVTRQSPRDKASQSAVAGKPAAAGKAATKALANDDLSSGSTAGAGAPAGGSGEDARPLKTNKTEVASTPSEQLAKLEAFLDAMDSMDRETLVHNVLRGEDVDFPGRAKWEERLAAAKEAYVSQGREMIEKARQIIASTDGAGAIQDPNDSRAKQLHARLQDLMGSAVQTGLAFQAVMMEGRHLASQAAAH